MEPVEANATMSPANNATASQTGYVLGAATRHTVNFLLFPYATIGRYLAVTLTSRARSWRRPGVRKSTPTARALAGTSAATPAGPGSDALRRSLSHPDPEVRLAAVDTLGALDGERAAVHVVHLLHDPEPDIRRAVAEAAARANASSAVFALIMALEDPVLEVRHAVKAAIGTLTETRVDIDVSQPVSSQHQQQLKKLWKAKRLAELTPQLRLSLEPDGDHDG